MIFWSRLLQIKLFLNSASSCLTLRLFNKPTVSKRLILAGLALGLTYHHSTNTEKSKCCHIDWVKYWPTENFFDFSCISKTRRNIHVLSDAWILICIIPIRHPALRGVEEAHILRVHWEEECHWIWVSFFHEPTSFVYKLWRSIVRADTLRKGASLELLSPDASAAIAP